MSLGGARIVVPLAVGIGGTVFLTLLDGGGAVTLLARVIECRVTVDEGVAEIRIAFGDFPSEHRERVAAMIATRTD